jgi:hypothetical protein
MSRKKKQRVLPTVSVTVSMPIPEPIYSKLQNLCRKHNFDIDEVIASSIFQKVSLITIENAFQDPQYRQCTKETIQVMRGLYANKIRSQFQNML